MGEIYEQLVSILGSSERDGSLQKATWVLGDQPEIDEGRSSCFYFWPSWNIQIVFDKRAQLFKELVFHFPCDEKGQIASQQSSQIEFLHRISQNDSPAEVQQKIKLTPRTSIRAGDHWEVYQVAHTHITFVFDQMGRMLLVYVSYG
ncbi:MAG TPA: hypothetical protein V6C81_31640 [Planktothrix sp.]|jgi:pyridoxine/pyridoxamine 5'-phosphate oxidase